jgi:hypothetical protein
VEIPNANKDKEEKKGATSKITEKDDRGRAGSQSSSARQTNSRSTSPSKTDEPVQSVPVIFQKKTLNDTLQTSPTKSIDEHHQGMHKYPPLDHIFAETKTADELTASEIKVLNSQIAKMDRFKTVLQQPTVDLGTRWLYFHFDNQSRKTPKVGLEWSAR